MSQPGLRAEPRDEIEDKVGARVAPAVAVPDMTPVRRRFRLPAQPLKPVAFGLGALVAVLALYAMASRTDSHVLLGVTAAVATGLALAAVRTARPSVSAVPVVVRKQDSMMDVLVGRELARARRHGTNLSVASVSLASARGDGRPASSSAMGEVANDFAGALRVTDVVAYSRGRRRLTVLLSDTSADGAHRLLRRLESRPTLAGRVRIGVASFPEEAVTYRALKELAAKREQPLAGDGTGTRRSPTEPSIA
jgi:hypothetical protein